jgi:Raf kinase inhibitor-like YbhB/YbcL family protein
MCVAVIWLGGCGTSTSLRTSGQPTPTTTAVPETITLTSSAFMANGAIPPLYTCDGQNISPPLAWDGGPQQTVTFVLIVVDLTGGSFTHWVLFNVPSATQSLPAGIPRDGQLANGARQGTNSLGMLGYYGPCPTGPKGRTDEYHFILYALGAALSLDAGASKEQVLDAAESHMLAKGELVGTYSVR